MSSIQVTSSSSPPLIASKTSHIQMAVPQPITKFMVSINQSGQTILPVTSGIQPPPASSIYVVGQAAASRLQYVSMVGNIGNSLSSNISLGTNFDPPHSLTMPQKLASRIPLSKPRLAIPAQHLGDQRQFFSTDYKNAALISPVTSKNAPIISNLMPISKQITNVTVSSIPNSSFISPTQQKLLLPQSRAPNITRNPLPASAIALSINQQKNLAINWSSASPSIIPLAQLINKTSSGHLHHEQLTLRAQGQSRPENHTLLLVANPFPQQQPKMLSPILSGPINLSTQSNKNSVQSQALNLTINRQQAIILTSTPASLRTSIPISTNLVINKLGSPISGLNLTRPKKNIRLNPASTTTILNQHASVSSASKQAHTVVSIQPVSSQIVQQSQPQSNFTPIAKVTPQLHLFQQQHFQHQQLQHQQQQFQNQIFQNQSIQLFQSQQQLQNQQHLQNQHTIQNQQLQSHQLQNQQQNLQLLQSQQQMQNQQALQSFQGQQQLQIHQTQQQKLQQHLLQQPKLSTVASFNSSATPIRLQSSQLGRISDGVQLLSPTSVSLSMIAAGLPFSLANEQNILQIDRSLNLKSLSGEEDSGSRLMHVSMEQLSNRSNHPLSNPMTHTITQASIGLMVAQPNLSQAIHVQNTKGRQQSMSSQSGICFAGAVVSSGKLQPYFANMDSPKAIVNFHVSAAPSTPDAGVLSQVLLTSPIFHQQQPGSNDIIIKQQQQQQQLQLPPPQNSSPRPSILRKTVDVFVNPNIRKNLISQLSTTQNVDNLPQNDVPVIVTNTQITPIDIVRENSQSSTDTASPSEGLIKPNLKLNVHENGAQTNKVNNICKLIPRKKPRKQSLHMCPDAAEMGELIADEIVMAEDDADIIADENEAVEADDEDDVLNDEKSNIEISINDSDITEYIDKNGFRWTLEKKRPNITMSQQYHCSWKPKYNHFNSILDVKPKEEKRQTLNEIANQKNIQEKISGSKLFLIAAQFDQLRDGENEMEQQLGKLKDSLLANNENKFKLSDEELVNFEELIMSNIQRSQTCASQYDDVTDLLLKLVERKTKVSEILNKHQSKRTSKKKKVPTATLR